MQPELRKVLVFIILSGLSLFFLPSIAKAEEYYFDAGNSNVYENSQGIIHPQTSQYIYGYMSHSPYTIDYYSYAPTAFTSGVTIELLIPKGEENFHPNLVLADPKSRAMIGEVPFGFPNIGGRVFSWEEADLADVSDNDLGLEFIRGPQTVRDFSPQGYTIGVFDPNGTGGRYILHIIAGRSDQNFFEAIWARLGAFIRIKLNLY